MAGIMSGTRGVIVVFVAVGIAVYLMSNGATTPSPSSAQAGNSTPTATSHTSRVQPTSAGDAANANNATAPSDPNTDGANNAPTSKWTYEDQKDELRGITMHFATLESENALNFGFPYGESTGRIALRRKGRSVDVMLQMTGGQFICNSFNDDTVAVKFDNGPIRRFGCAESADGDTKTIFLLNASRFIKGLKGSSQVRIEAQFFQAGLQQLAFNTTGLKW